MYTPKKKKSDEGFYPRSQYEDGIFWSLDSSDYNCLTQTNCDDVSYYTKQDKRAILNKKVVNFNVGGTKYTTTLSTLANDKNSNLFKYAYSIVNDLESVENDPDYEGYINTTDANSGGVANIFIDRDGKNFQYVLNFLRDGELICPEDNFVYQSILSDAKFYNLIGLYRVVSARLNLKVEPTFTPTFTPKETDRETYSSLSQNTQLDLTDSIPNTQLSNHEIYLPLQNRLYRIQENDNIEESSPFISGTPVRLLGEQTFSTTADF